MFITTLLAYKVLGLHVDSWCCHSERKTQMQSW